MSDSGASTMWSGEQLSWLQALGHTVYLDRSLPAEMPASSSAEVVEATAAPAPAPSMPPMAAARPAARRAPESPAEEVARDPAAAAVVAAPTRRGRLPDRLQLALLRASGLNPGDPATRTVMDTWPLAELRADPQAKRALWSQLRALRRQSRGP
ncbi:MAG TPA: alanine acetyltransferase [Stenotrophomonas sp.]|jgi:hypothetical protein